MSTSPPDGDYAVPYAGAHEQLSGHGLPMGQPIYYNTLSQGYYGNQGQFRGRGGGRYKVSSKNLMDFCKHWHRANRQAVE